MCPHKRARTRTRNHTHLGNIALVGSTCLAAGRTAPHRTAPHGSSLAQQQPVWQQSAQSRRISSAVTGSSQGEHRYQDYAIMQQDIIEKATQSSSENIRASVDYYCTGTPAGCFLHSRPWSGGQANLAKVRPPITSVLYSRTEFVSKSLKLANFSDCSFRTGMPKYTVHYIVGRMSCIDIIMDWC